MSRARYAPMQLAAPRRVAVTTTPVQGPNVPCHGVFVTPAPGATVPVCIGSSPAITPATGFPVTLAGPGGGGAASYAAQVQLDGASAHWRLNETSGTVASDSLGSAHGTISGGVTLGVPGPLADGSTAARFSGGTGRIAIPAGAYGNFGSGPWAYEVWLRYVPTGGSDMNALESTYQAGRREGVNFLINSADAFFGFEFISSTTPAFLAIVADKATGNNQWHLFTAVMQRGPDVLVTYLDGVAVRTDPFADAGVLVITNQLNLGLRFNFSADQPYTGDIDEVAIYHVALTPAQVLNHYNLGRTASSGSGVASKPLHLEVKNLNELYFVASAAAEAALLPYSHY